MSGSSASRQEQLAEAARFLNRAQKVDEILRLGNALEAAQKLAARWESVAKDLKREAEQAFNEMAARLKAQHDTIQDLNDHLVWQSKHPIRHLLRVWRIRLFGWRCNSAEAQKEPQP